MEAITANTHAAANGIMIPKSKPAETGQNGSAKSILSKNAQTVPPFAARSCMSLLTSVSE